MNIYQIFLTTAVLLVSSLSTQAKGVGAASGQPKCKDVQIPTIICPAGKTLADKDNGCHAGMVTKRVCKNVASLTGKQGYFEVIQEPENKTK